MNTAALIIAAGLPTYDCLPAAMFNVGAVSTARHMIASFEKAGLTSVYLVTDESTKKLEKQLSSDGVLFLRCEGSSLEAAKKAIVSLPLRYDRVLLCTCTAPLVMPHTIEQLLSARGEIVRAKYEDRDSDFFVLDMDAAEILCADTSAHTLSDAMGNLGYPISYVRSHDKGLVCPPGEAAADEAAMEAHQLTLTRPTLEISISAEQMIFEPRLIRLLRLVSLLRSVRDACEMLGISYSIAWTLLNNAEEQLGFPLVRRNQGGRSGTGSELTEKGRMIVEKYGEFENAMNEKMNSLYHEHFDHIL